MTSRTPLYEWHRRAGARFIEFGGWEMPLQYSGIVREHLAVRNAAGLFDVSHMGKLLVEGEDAHAYLDRVSANAVPRTPGRARYTHLLREDGTIVDDVIVTCLRDDRYFIVCNAGPRALVVAFLAERRPASVSLDDRTAATLCIALQGPRAPEVLQRCTSTSLDGMRAFAAAVIPFSWTSAPAPRVSGPPSPVETGGWGDARAEAVPIRDPAARGEPSASDGTARFLITRTGYTGEAGFELFPDARAGLGVWEALIGQGSDIGLMPAGLGARDTLRLEKGYLLSGKDFDGRQTPLEVNGARLVKWTRSFQGREALAAQREAGTHRRLVGLRMEDRAIPRHSCEVLLADDLVGTVTSGTMSPSLRVGIALASVEPRAGTPGTEVEIGIRDVRHPAKVVPLPFL